MRRTPSARRESRPSPAPDTVELIDRTGRVHDPALSWLAQSLHAILPRLGRPVQHVTVQIIDDRRMAVLHGRHRGAATTTDVLTFPLSEAGEPVDVDIAVCRDEAERQAAARRHPLERELLLYCLHGLLHCSGFDDRTPEGFHAMHAREDELLEAIGVGAVFGAPRT